MKPLGILFIGERGARDGSKSFESKAESYCAGAWQEISLNQCVYALILISAKGVACKALKGEV